MTWLDGKNGGGEGAPKKWKKGKINQNLRKTLENPRKTDLVEGKDVLQSCGPLVYIFTVLAMLAMRSQLKGVLLKPVG